MRSLWRVVPGVLIGLPVLCATSIVAQDKSAEELYKAKELDAVRTYPADSGKDAERTSSRQGYGHIRQGNSTKQADYLGRSHAPYGAEHYGEELENFGLRRKLEDRLEYPAWELGIDIKEPRRIVITRPDGTAEEFWYVLYRVTNTTMRTDKDTSVSDYNPQGTDGGADPVWVKLDIPDVGVRGVPVHTTLTIDMETYTLDSHALPRDTALTPEDDHVKELGTELDKERGKGLSGKVDENDAENRAKMLKDRYANSRKVYKDCGDPFVIKAIAEAEELWEWRDGKREYILWPSSAFKRDLAPAHNYTSYWLDGPRCLPREIVRIGPNNSVERTYRWPAIYDDDKAFAGWYGDGDALPEGARLVKDENDAMYGKLTLVRYQNYDVVDRFGRVVREGHPSYLGAKAAGGEIIKDGSAHGREKNLEELIGTAAKRPPHRIYREGDRVLNGWDTKVELPGHPNETYKIWGKIIGPKDQAAHQAYLWEKENLVRREHNPEAADNELGRNFIAAANEDRYAAAETLSAGTTILGRDPVGEKIPVKLVDHLGRAVRRQIVTYEVGERITEKEYRIWAERFPKEVVAKFPGSPWTRALKADDFMVGLPKIKMGRCLDQGVNVPEDLDRGEFALNEKKQAVRKGVTKYKTGRMYDPKLIKPAHFMRDPEGEFFTNRTPPVPEGVLADGEDYVYAPYGAAAEGADPVPAFDRMDDLGVWKDYVDPMTGSRIPLRDASGQLVRDSQDQLQYVKEYEFEWLYAYEFETIPEDDAAFQGKYNTDPRDMTMVDVKVFKKDGQVVGLALPRVIEMVDAPEGFANVTDGIEPSGGAEVPKVKIVKRLVFPEDANSGLDGKEKIEQPEDYVDKKSGYTVETVKLEKYMYEYLKSTLRQDTGRKRVAASEFDPVTPKTNGLDDAVKTYDRWMIPAPLVYLDAEGKPRAQTRVEERIGPARKADGTDAPRAHVHYISERWGAFVFRDIDRHWDYMNVHVRGLRPSYARRGRNIEEFSVTAPSAPDSPKVSKARYDTKWFRQDWVYLARFERLGDQYENFRDLVRPVRESWYLRAEKERGQ